jgi:hypothetical protein
MIPQAGEKMNEKPLSFYPRLNRHLSAIFRRQVAIN